MTGCAASTEPGSGAAAAGTFDAERTWRLHPQVALRDENFGALAYHYGNRRLVFLKSPQLVRLVVALEHYPCARAAVDDVIAPSERAGYTVALGRLARSGVISEIDCEVRGVA